MLNSAVSLTNGPRSYYCLGIGSMSIPLLEFYTEILSRKDGSSFGEGMLPERNVKSLCWLSFPLSCFQVWSACLTRSLSAC